MEHQEPHNETAPNGEQPTRDTQPNALVRRLATVTRQLPAAEVRHPPAETRHQREQIAALVMALGDPGHILHHQAVNDLVAIGDPAVPALCEALDARRPWLVSFRAAEALGQIGDGRATGPLLDALRHPNSNVRWSAVTAIATIGDARSLLELRRIARDDRGKTSWGEPVAGAAQSALDQLRTQNVLLRSSELLKTAVACVLMLVGLVVAWSVITTLRDELGRIGREPLTASGVAALVRTAQPTTQRVATPAPQPTSALPTAVPPPAASSVLTGTVLTTGNVRTLPSRELGQRIGIVSVGDEVVFLAASPDLGWYRVRLSERRAAGSQITSSDGTGWVISTVLSPPGSVVPIENVELPAAAPTPPAATP